MGPRGRSGRSRSASGIGDQRSQGVSVEVGESEAAVDSTIVVEYGESIRKLAQQIRENVTRWIEGIDGALGDRGQRGDQ